jgi:hypothetical protein
MNEWAEKCGIDVEIVQVNDYIESINQNTAGAFDGVSATNMSLIYALLDEKNILDIRNCLAAKKEESEK